VFTLRWCHGWFILGVHQIFSVNVYLDEHPRMLSMCRLAMPSS
jgi:lantibiotic modifying enzyme